MAQIPVPFGYDLLPLPPLQGQRMPVAPPPETLLGGAGPDAEALVASILARLPPLPPHPDAVPMGQGLQPQSAREAQELAQDAQSGGYIATAMGLPGMHHASRNLQRAIDAGDAVQGAGAVGQMGLQALPFTRYAGQAVRSLPSAFGFTLGGGTTVAAGEGDLSRWIGRAQAQGRPRAGQPDPAILELQRSLKQQGDYDGPLDGLDGPETRAAMQRARTRQEADREAQRRAQELEAGRLQQERETLAGARTDADRRADERAQGLKQLEEHPKDLPIGHDMRGAGGRIAPGIGEDRFWPESPDDGEGRRSNRRDVPRGSRPGGDYGNK